MTTDKLAALRLRVKASKDTGFHPSDSDWTRGRAQAVAEAEAIARRQINMARAVTLAAAALRKDEETPK
jgi:hypothetical protein